MVVYAKSGGRKTIQDSLYCFRRYVPKHSFFYFNIDSCCAIDKLITYVPFDGIIFHYSFLSQRYAPSKWEKIYKKVKNIF
jgi:hypothetical protein